MRKDLAIAWSKRAAAATGVTLGVVVTCGLVAAAAQKRPPTTEAPEAQALGAGDAAALAKIAGRSGARLGAKSRLALPVDDGAEVTIDAYPGRTFEATVDSLAGGTGARFSIIPPDNASGNFVKVVQRVPVRLAWKTEPDVPLRAGLSADVTVTVGETN